MIGKYPRTAAIREERRKRAEDVQARARDLSLQERLDKLNALGLVAKRERLKLARRLEAAAAAAVKPSKKKS